VENINQITETEKIEYLKQWHWQSEPHPSGFDVWSNIRFPNKKYKLDRAYDVMKANEPSIEPILTARLDNPEEMGKVKEFLDALIDPDYEKKQAIKGLAKLIGTDPDELARNFDKSIY
jgi:hypothetical protein